ncbi:MAG: ankyrin repeat domain-containing protein [Candidatus Hydrogenedentes bacterium]|nr:ankyrin repeat domain-containing protein [Candidatus Hydrogenedentota bacterium]
MNRAVFVLIVLGVAIAIVLSAALLKRGTSTADPPAPTLGAGPSPLHEAAGAGESGAVEQLLADGADPNVLDDQGKTPLHWSAANGHMQMTERLLKAGSKPGIRDVHGKSAFDYAYAGGHMGTAELLANAAGQAMPSEPPAPELPPAIGAVTSSTGQHLNPSLKFPDLPSFEAAIGQPGLLLTSDHVWLFAPKASEAGAQTVFPILVRAYDELHRITGIHTEYIMVVYNFSKGHKEAFGGTGNCVIYYDDENLQLDRQEEWNRYGVPHVSGYIEEMAHNFVGTSKAQFGWEMIGWSIGVNTTLAVASNPIFVQSLNRTRQGQAETFQRYVAAGFVFPADVESNLVDRIHAHLLGQCEQQYGPSFWPDFFTEVRKEAGALRDAVNAGKDDDTRNARYRITVDCFDRLPGLHFKQLLANSGISLTTDVKSLHPTEPGWNRRLK